MEQKEIISILSEFKKNLDVLQRPFYVEQSFHNTKVKLLKFDYGNSIRHEIYLLKLNKLMKYDSEKVESLCDMSINYLLRNNKKLSIATKSSFFGLVNEWNSFLTEKPNTDFWEANDFNYFLENELLILQIAIINHSSKTRDYIKSLNRLREIYNKRFSIEIEQENTPNILTSAPQRVLLMYELGIFDLLNNIPEIKDNPTKIAKLVSEFTGENIDTIRKPYLALTSDRDTSGYNFKSVKNVKALNNVYKKIGIERKKR
jgi:hypothetical protein